jgi:hypothetical protein
MSIIKLNVESQVKFKISILIVFVFKTWEAGICIPDWLLRHKTAEKLLLLLG